MKRGSPKAQQRAARARGAVELWGYRREAAKRFAELRQNMLTYLADCVEGVSRTTLNAQFAMQEYSVSTLLAEMVTARTLVKTADGRYRLSVDKWIETVSA